MFYTKVVEFKRFIYWSYHFYLKWRRQDQVKVTSILLSGNIFYCIFL